MSAFQDIKAGFRKISKTVISRTDELAEEAALAVKKKAVEAHLSEAYEKLGRIAYQLLAKDGAAIRDDEEFLVVSCEISRLRKELSLLDKNARKSKEQTGTDASTAKGEAPETEKTEDGKSE